MIFKILESKSALVGRLPARWSNKEGRNKTIAQPPHLPNLAHSVQLTRTFS
jgi:hypothetical protein